MQAAASPPPPVALPQASCILFPFAILIRNISFRRGKSWCALLGVEMPGNPASGSIDDATWAHLWDGLRMLCGDTWPGRGVVSGHQCCFQYSWQCTRHSRLTCGSNSALPPSPAM